MALAPSRLQDFRLDAKIGTGSTARVFGAERLATGERVAIKMLEPAASTSHEHRERLAREALLLAQVTSPHVAKIIGFGYEKDKPFLVLERLVGETVDDVIKREKVPIETLAVWVEEILIGLRDIHALGIIHRDIKPSNLFLSKSPSGQITVKLIDFGVARLRDASLVKEVLTSTNHVIGSLGYMAPEQFHRARAVTQTADLYALGVVIYRALTGRLPFVDRSLAKVLKMKTEDDPPRLSSVPGVRIHPMIDEFVDRTLAREPQLRFQTAREMLEAWWRATAAASVEPPPPPATIEGIDVVFDEESAPNAATMQALHATLAGAPPEMPSPGSVTEKNLKSIRSDRAALWVESDPTQITRPR